MNGLPMPRTPSYSVVASATGICTGVAAAFFLLPFLFAGNNDEFAQWLQAIAGPLSFASVSLIAFTTILQQQQHERDGCAERERTCERLLETFVRLLDTSEVVKVQQHAAPHEFRRGARGFGLLRAEYDKILRTSDLEVRDRVRLRFLRKYAAEVAPFVSIALELMKANEALRRDDAVRAAAVTSRVLAVVPFDCRFVLVLFGGDSVSELKRWMNVD